VERLAQQEREAGPGLQRHVARVEPRDTGAVANEQQQLGGVQEPGAERAAWLDGDGPDRPPRRREHLPELRLVDRAGADAVSERGVRLLAGVEVDDRVRHQPTSCTAGR
jgi:hypothetical protein